MVNKSLLFKSWIKYCFDGEKRKHTEPPTLNPMYIAIFLKALFKNCNRLPRIYSDEKISEGLWFICGSESQYFDIATEPEVPDLLKIQVIKSVKYLYTKLFGVRCIPYCSHLKQGSKIKNPLNSVCYMLWDMDSLQYAIRKNKTLLNVGFEIFNMALNLENIACVESALHGLGHLDFYPESKILIDRYLVQGKMITPELEKYALYAMEGNVQ